MQQSQYKGERSSSWVTASSLHTLLTPADLPPPPPLHPSWPRSPLTNAPLGLRSLSPVYEPCDACRAFVSENVEELPQAKMTAIYVKQMVIVSPTVEQIIQRQVGRSMTGKCLGQR